MSINLLAINVGNTRSQFAAFVDDQIQDVTHLPHGTSQSLADALTQAAAPLEARDDAVIYLSSTNGKQAERVAAEVRKVLGRPVVRMEHDINVPIGRKLDPESITGEDRLLNAAAAYDRLKQACIVIDAGTAVTVDFVDGEGTFHGGAILPGARMMLEALHQYTAQLPEIAVKQPTENIGHNTAEAMLSGVYHGIRGAVRELTEKYAETYGAYPQIIATGGDSKLLFEGYELVESIVPDLTLWGMFVTRRYEIEQAD